MRSHSAGRMMMNLLFLFFFALTLTGCNENSTGSSIASSDKSSKAGTSKSFEKTAASVSVVNETLGSGVQNIYIAGLSGKKAVYTDFGGEDIYTVLPTMAGDVEIRDNQASIVNLPPGLAISSASFLSNGVQFTVNGFTLTLIGKPELFSFVFAGSPLVPGSGVTRTLDQTAQSFGTVIPGSGQPMNQATITGTIQNDGSIKPLSTDSEPPSVPAGLTASQMSSSSIWLSWSASTDNIGVTGYKVYRGGVFVSTVTTTSFTDTGLTASTNYCYTVSAIDAAGNESQKGSAICVNTAAWQDSSSVFGSLSEVSVRVTDPVDASTHDITELVRVGDLVTLTGAGFTGASTVILKDSADTSLRVTPTSFSETGIAFTFPAGLFEGKINIAVDSGSTVSNELPLTLVSSAYSIIYDPGNISVTPGSSITITGQNLSASAVNVMFGSISQTVAASAVTARSVTTTVPDAAASGSIRVVANGTSNEILYSVKTGINGSVTMPSSSALTRSSLQVKFSNETASISQSGTFQLSVSNQSVSTVAIYAPDSSAHGSAPFLLATVLPGQTSVTMSPASTAADLVFIALGLDMTLSPSSYSAAMGIVVNSSAALATYLNQRLSSDPYFLENFNNAELLEQIHSAVSTASIAIDQAISAGSINHRSKALKASISSKSSTINPYIILPFETRSNFTVTFEKSGAALSGRINIENGTMLYADVEAVDAYASGNVIQKFENSIYSSNLIQPQQGLGLFHPYYEASVKPVNLKTQCARVTIRTPGLIMDSGHDYVYSPSLGLAFRTIMSQVVIPVIKSLTSLPISETAAVRITKYMHDMGVFDGLEIYFTSGDYKGAVEKILSKIDAPMIKALSTDILDSVISDKASGLAAGRALILKNMLKWADLVMTGANLLKVGYELGQTPCKIEYMILFPMSVDSVTPAAVTRDGMDKSIVIEGKGLDPFKTSGDSLFTPNAIFTDADDQFVCFATPDYSYPHLAIENGMTDYISYTLPGNSLTNAKGPIKLVLKRRFLYANAPDGYYVAEVESPTKIAITDGLSLTSITPAQAAVGDQVTLTGTGFSADAASNTVSFTGAAGAVSAAVLSASTTSLVVAVPQGAITGNVTVTTGSKTSNGQTFTLKNTGPSIAGISPATAAVGDQVTLTGTGFGPTAAENIVSFTGSAGAIGAVVVSASSTSLVVTVPQGAITGGVAVTVGSITSNAVNFTLKAATAIRYQDNGDGCVTDLKTGLVWKKASEPGAYTWYEAITMPGLPSKDQLLSLVPDSYEERQEMYDTFTGYYYYCWSSTPYAGNLGYGNNAWVVPIDDGGNYWGYMNHTYHVRLLCTGQ